MRCDWSSFRFHRCTDSASTSTVKQKPEDLPAALDAIGRPGVLKTRRFGYDGKGQVLIRNGEEPGAAWNAVGGAASILEAFVPFEREISVVAARGRDGRIACFDVTENEHRDNILKISRVPAQVSAAVAADTASSSLVVRA